MKAIRKIILVNIMSSLAILLMFCLNVPMAAAEEKDNNYDCITVDAAINSYDLEALAADLGIDKYELMLLIDDGTLFFDIQLCEDIKESAIKDLSVSETSAKSAARRPIWVPPRFPDPAADEDRCKCDPPCPKGYSCKLNLMHECRCFNDTDGKPLPDPEAR